MKITSILTIALLIGASSAFAMTEEEARREVDAFKASNSSSVPSFYLSYLDELMSTPSDQESKLPETLEGYKLFFGKVKKQEFFSQLNGGQELYLKSLLPFMDMPPKPHWVKDLKDAVEGYQIYLTAEKSGLFDKLSRFHRDYFNFIVPPSSGMTSQPNWLENLKEAIQAHELYLRAKEQNLISASNKEILDGLLPNYYQPAKEGWLKTFQEKFELYKESPSK